MSQILWKKQSQAKLTIKQMSRHWKKELANYFTSTSPRGAGKSSKGARRQGQESDLRFNLIVQLFVHSN
jgi:hypothetical protein